MHAATSQHPTLLAHYPTTSSSTHTINTLMLLSFPAPFQSHPMTPKARPGTFQCYHVPQIISKSWSNYQQKPYMPLSLPPREVKALPVTDVQESTAQHVLGISPPPGRADRYRVTPGFTHFSSADTILLCSSFMPQVLPSEARRWMLTS